MQNRKYISRFIIFLFLSLLLLFLWSFPLTGIYFDCLDSTVYYFLNGTLKSGENWQLFWAITNIRIFDLTGGLLVFVILLFHMYSGKNSGNNATPYEKFIAFIVFTALTLFLNKVIFSGVLDFLDYHRQSPSLILDGGVRLSEIITSFEFKDTSKDCFPGDHAAVLICSTVYFFIYGNKKLGVISCFVLLPLILPRLVVGAHWFTDCLVGSIFILINSFNIWINIPAIKTKLCKKNLKNP
ncbi:MAG: phosphatase PAP2 family protein [Desulfobacterales bacterium]|nr:phosphatase PAP2 family protein [Desulfobacterales bacterium]